MQSLQFRFRYSEAEYLGAARLLILKEKSVLVRMVVFLLMILFGAIMLAIIGDFGMPLWSVLAMALLVDTAFVYNIFFNMPRRYFRKNDNLRDEFQLSFSHEGVSVKTSQIDSKLAWTLYTKVAENSSLYVIVYGKDARMMTAVPKRVFQSAHEELEFRRLLREHVDQQFPATNGSIEARTQQYVPSGSEPPDWR